MVRQTNEDLQNYVINQLNRVASQKDNRKAI